MAGYSKRCITGGRVVESTQRSWTCMRTYLLLRRRDRRSKMASPASALNWIEQAKSDLLTVLQDSDHDGRDWEEWADHLFEAGQLLTEAQQHVQRAIVAAL
jgi:hypothetical protein